MWTTPSFCQDLPATGASGIDIRISSRVVRRRVILPSPADRLAAIADSCVAGHVTAIRGAGMRLRQTVRLAKKELRAFRDLSKTSGGRNALVARARGLLGLDELEARLRVHGHQTEATRSELTATQQLVQAGFNEHRDETEQTKNDLNAIQKLLATDIDGLAADARSLRDDAEATRNALVGTQELLQAGLEMVDRRYREQTLCALVEPVTEWVRNEHIGETVLLSVVLATRNRRSSWLGPSSPFGPRCTNIGSWWSSMTGARTGRSSFWQTWPPKTAGLSVVPNHRGSARRATRDCLRHDGEYVCYLDDDNVMRPLWLKAVAFDPGNCGAGGGNRSGPRR